MSSKNNNNNNNTLISYNSNSHNPYNYKTSYSNNSSFNNYNLSYLEDSYRKNREFANKLKNKWNNRGDPILQRTDNYIEKNKPIQTCSKNYFDRIREKENNMKNQNNNINNYNNYNNNYDEFNKKSGKKHYDMKEYELYNRRFNDINYNINNNTHIKIFPNRYSTREIGSLISQEKNDNSNNKNEYKPQKKYIINFKPSEEYVKMNNKHNLLPSENNIFNNNNNNVYNNYNNNVNNNYRRPKSSKNMRFNNDSFKNTSQRLFGYSIEDNDENNKDNNNNENYLNYNNNNNKKYRLINKIEEKDKIDHINDLISYKFGPNFKEDKLSIKINNVNPEEIKEFHKKNFQENFNLYKIQ